jgi:hypothetical protein
MFTHDPLEPLVRAYERARLQEFEQAWMRRLARQGPADSGQHREWTRMLLASLGQAPGACAILVALVAMIVAAALLVAGGHPMAL